jgi:FkbM family methyltransferase
MVNTTRLRNLARWRPARRIQGGVGEGLRIGRSQASADYAQGDNELPVQHALADLLHPGDVFVDIGANVGFFSLLAARVVGDAGRVYAIEPVPENVEAIRANVRRNHFANVSVIEEAASDTVGTTTLTLTRHPGGAAIASADAPPDAIGELTVPTTTIDALVSDGRIAPPSVLKIDVEGAEEAVLAGLADTLRNHAPLLVLEVDGPDEATLAQRRQVLVDQLATADYTVTDLDAGYPETMDWRVAHMVCRPAPSA